MSDPEVTSVDPTVLIDRASGKGQPSSKPASPSTTSEVVSVDPTALIDQAGRSPAPEAIEPTILVPPRGAPARTPAPARPAPARPAPTPRHDADPVAVEPTVLITPQHRQPQPSQRSGVQRTTGPSFWARLTSSGNRAPRQQSATPRGGDRWSPTTRGVLLAVAAVAAMGLVVLAVILASRWLVSGGGKVLTITKPEHGTLVGDVIECGTDGSTCSATFSDTERVDLRAVPDEGYTFQEFTGPCKPAGRVLMSEARTCGAIFVATPVNPPTVTWTLTIDKPTGGTVSFGQDIICGSLESRCTATLPGSASVKLETLPDAGFKFLRFTGECAPDGVTKMTASRTCGATFGPVSAAPIVSKGPDIVRSHQDGGIKIATTTIPPTPPPATTTVPPVGGGQEQTTVVTKAGGDKPEPTAEEHAQAEIILLVKNYCSALETRDPAKVQVLFSNVDKGVLRDQFRQYKSLKCDITSPPQFERLDARPNGGAQVKFGMKQVIQMKSGGAPQTVETDVTMVTSRMDFGKPWFIDRVDHVAKPKP